MRLVLLRDLHFVCIFIDEIKSELFTHTKLLQFYCKPNVSTTIVYSYTAAYSGNSNYLFPRAKQERNC